MFDRYAGRGIAGVVIAQHAVGVRKSEARLARRQLGLGEIVEKKKRREEPPARREHAMGFVQILPRLLEQQMREERRGDDEVERRVVERKAKPRRVRAATAVLRRAEADQMEPKVWMPRRDVPPAPPHAAAHDVKSVVGRGRLEIARQRNGHPSDAAADVEHAIAVAQSAVADQKLEHLLADGAEVAHPHEAQSQRRQLRIGFAGQPEAQVEVRGEQVLPEIAHCTPQPFRSHGT